MNYKLIKKYPGSPELNTIIEKNDGWWYMRTIKGNLSLVLIDSPNNYPEFWEPYDPTYSKLSNSQKGSLHWLNTLLGRVRRCGEHLKTIENAVYDSSLQKFIPVQKVVKWI